ncbi:hypothetical protein EW146_g4654 [Bondarzewia mesenterica]|uniref:Thioester reductase (TE) domain-containing protein n=1 Tax=Bondarzewia mesenterica TaxID=1095465 RepID=A0A4S4LU26_9AGAM|nr:hypothetical protein EW146_g4654 [Bondarzewia mesenterica]
MSKFTIPPLIPTPQAANCPTFRPPPVDGTRTVPEFFEFNAEHNPEHPLFIYPDGENGTKTICYPEAWRMIKRTAKIVHGYHKLTEDRYVAQEGIRPKDQPPTVGILAVSDNVSFFSMLVGTMRLGIVPFSISPRNSPVAVAHLISKTHVIQLFVSPDPAMQRLAAESLKLLEKDGIHVDILPMIQYHQVSDASELAMQEDLNMQFDKLELDNTAVMLHSSDGMGLVNITWSCTSGIIMGSYKPSSPPTLATPENYLEAVIATKSSAWFNNPVNIPAMKSLRAIVFSGAPLNKEIGDALVKMGVVLVPFYATTEIGCFSMTIPAKVPHVDEWEYFQITSNLNVEMLPQEGSDDISEATIIDSPYYNPNVLNAATSDGRRVYRTSDLLQQHPRDPTRWRVFGRADDQLMLSTGEKTNPGPLEAILAQDPHIASVLMFGRGRFQNGVLIDPRKEFNFNPKDEQKLIEFRNKIWPTVERLNQFAPAHSRLFKEMIIVADPSKPFEYTPKGTPRRHVVIKAYDPEIEALYKAVTDSSQTGIPAPEKWTESATLVFVRSAVEKVMKRSLRDNDDIFQEGCDSLQATWIKNTILHALRESTNISPHGLPNNFVYSNPTIASLTIFVIKLFLQDVGERNELGEKAQSMVKMLAKYVSGFPAHKPTPGVADAASPDEVVLLTGSTGRLGCHILAQLVARSSVKKVYALNRGASMEDLKERQLAALKTWGLGHVMESEKVTLVVADLAKSDFGIRNGYAEIRESITSVIHNAWRVDFNLALSSFEPLIAGVRNLVNLSLSCSRPTPPPILFTSSVSVVMSQTSSPVPETPIDDVTSAIGTGYGESKWVAENVLFRAAKEAGVRTNVVRIGQLCGDSVSGGWNEKEWVPVLLRGSQVLGAFPQRREAVSWIPVDIAASALLDMLGSNEPVLHLVHPHSVDWSVISDTASQLLGVPSIPYTEWAAKLQEVAKTSAVDRDILKKESCSLSARFLHQRSERRRDGHVVHESGCECVPHFERGEAAEQGGCGKSPTTITIFLASKMASTALLRSSLTKSITPNVARRSLVPFARSNAKFAYVPGGPILRGGVNDPTTFPPPSKTHGSYHWAFERLLSAGLVPLTAAAFVTSGSTAPLLDGLLGVSLVMHSHIGFDAILVDYLHPRKFPVLGPIFKWTLRAVTVGVLAGVYQFNTQDVGLTELIRRVWTA